MRKQFLVLLLLAGCATKRVPVKTVDVDRQGYSYRCDTKTGICFVWVRDGRLASAQEELCSKQYVCTIGAAGQIFRIERKRR